MSKGGKKVLLFSLFRLVIKITVITHHKAYL